MYVSSAGGKYNSMAAGVVISRNLSGKKDSNILYQDNN